MQEDRRKLAGKIFNAALLVVEQVQDLEFGEQEAAMKMAAEILKADMIRIQDRQMNTMSGGSMSTGYPENSNQQEMPAWLKKKLEEDDESATE